MRIALLFLTSSMLCGCSSMLETWKGRPFGSHNFRADKIYVMAADRRLMLTGKVDEKTFACPELSPEITTSRSASTKLARTLAEEKGLTLDDAITAIQMKGHEMDGSSQKFAMGLWALCTARLYGAIDKTTYEKELLALIGDLRSAMLAQAKPSKPAETPAPAPATPATPAATQTKPTPKS